MFLTTIYPCGTSSGEVDCVYALALSMARHGLNVVLVECELGLEDIQKFPYFAKVRALCSELHGLGLGNVLAWHASQADRGTPDAEKPDLGRVSSYLHEVDITGLDVDEAGCRYLRSWVEPPTNPGRLFVVPGGLTKVMPVTHPWPEPPGHPETYAETVEHARHPGIGADAADAVESATEWDTEGLLPLQKALHQLAVGLHEDLRTFALPPLNTDDGDAQSDDQDAAKADLSASKHNAQHLHAVLVRMRAGAEGLQDVPLFQAADQISILTDSDEIAQPALTAAILHLQRHCLTDYGSMATWLSIAVCVPPGSNPDDDSVPLHERPRENLIPPHVEQTIRRTCRSGRSGLPEVPPTIVQLQVGSSDSTGTEGARPWHGRVSDSDVRTWHHCLVLCRMPLDDEPVEPRHPFGVFLTPAFLDALHWSWPLGDVDIETARRLLEQSIFADIDTVPADLDAVMQLHSLGHGTARLRDKRLGQAWASKAGDARYSLEASVTETARMVVMGRLGARWLALSVGKRQEWQRILLGDRACTIGDKTRDEAIRLADASYYEVGTHAEYLSAVGKLQNTELQRQFASEVFRAALEQGPNTAVFHWEFARFLDATKAEPDRTEYHYRRTLELAPKPLVYRRGLGEFLARVRRDFDAADACYLSILESAPTDPYTHVYRARLMLEQGNAQEAIGHALQAWHNPRGGERLPFEMQVELAMTQLCLGPEDVWPQSVYVIARFNIRWTVGIGTFPVGALVSLCTEHPHYEWLKQLAAAFTNPDLWPALREWDLWRTAAAPFLKEEDEE